MLVFFYFYHQLSIFVYIPQDQMRLRGGVGALDYKLWNRWTHPSLFAHLPSSIKQTPFSCDRIWPVTFALLRWTPKESLLHLVLCCWLHLLTGIITPTQACLCPAIPSDFVQLANLTSPPC